MAKNGKGLGCPVCDGNEMRKLQPSRELELALDYCDGCGGMWFDHGEVRQLRLLSADVLGGLITMKKQLFTVDCGSCGRSMTRNAAECPACGEENLIDCPVCTSQLERVQSEVMTVDVCRDCRGVWFDNMDLSQVWNLDIEGTKASDEEITHDTVLAILQNREGGNGGADGSGNAFVTIADIVGGIFSTD